MNSISQVNITGQWFARADRTLGSQPEVLDVPVEVSGAQVASSAGTRDLFSEQTQTTLVFADGAVVRLSAAVVVGQLVFLRHLGTQREIVTRVLRQRNIAAGSAYVELEFTEAAPDFWNRELTPQPGATPVEAAVETLTEASATAFSDEQLVTGDSHETPSSSASRAAENLEESVLLEFLPTESQVSEPAFQESAVETPETTEVERMREEIAELRRQMSSMRENTPASSPVKAAVGSHATPAAKASDISEAIANLLDSATPSFLSAAPRVESNTVESRKNVGVERFAEKFAETATRFAEAIPAAPKMGSALDHGRNVDEVAVHDEDSQVHAPRSEALDEEELLLGAETEEALEQESGEEIAPAAISGAAAGGSRWSRIWLLAALLPLAAIGGFAYQQGIITSWFSSQQVTSSGVSASGTVVGSSKGALKPPATQVTARSIADKDAPHPATANSGKTPVSSSNDSSAADTGARTETGRSQKSAKSSGSSNGSVEQVSERSNVPRSSEAADAMPGADRDAGYEPPRVLKAVSAVPPTEAVEKFVTGDVKFETVIDAAGKVASEEVISGPEPLRQAALVALRKYEYKPAMRNGKPVTGQLVVTVKFWYEP